MFLTVDSDRNGDSPQFTLACISSGGPASCVIWRIDKRRIADPITTSVLTDSVAGRYTHTLTVTERIGGTYSCSVANDKPASDYEGFHVISEFRCKKLKISTKISKKISTNLAGPHKLLLYLCYSRTKFNTGASEIQSTQKLCIALANQYNYTGKPTL